LIVSEPPYDLVALFADLEMQKLVEAALERGQIPARGCMRPIRWRSLRDPRRDPVWREPDRSLGPFLTAECRFLIAWDHHGSGEEGRPVAEVEEAVCGTLTLRNIPRDRILAVAFEPELEIVLRPVWRRVVQIMAEERGVPVPDDGKVLSRARRSASGASIPEGEVFAEVLERHPKELFQALLHELRLRRSAPLYQKVGERVSLGGLKRESAVLRIAETVAGWFPPSET
jgi:hypothetical protein